MTCVSAPKAGAWLWLRKLPWVAHVAILLLAYVAPECLGDDTGPVLAEFDVPSRGAWLTVPVEFGGRSYPFVVDTGCAGWVCDTSLRRYLGAKVGDAVLRSFVSQTEAELYAMPAVEFAGLRAGAGAAACIDLRHAMGAAGIGAYGVVGTDVLRGRIFRIDFDRGKLQFLGAVGEDAGARFAVRWKDRVPHVLVDLPGAAQEEFLIDTGHSSLYSGYLRMPVYLRLLAAREINLVKGASVAEVSPVEGVTTTNLARMYRFKAGPFTHEGVLFGHAPQNVLGLGFLSRYICTFDLTNSAIYLRPGREYTRQDRYDLAGVQLARIDGKTLVDRLDEGGPAKLAGLLVRDEVVEVDGQPAARTSVLELNRMLATPGERRVRYVRKVGGAAEHREVTFFLTEPHQE